MEAEGVNGVPGVFKAECSTRGCGFAFVFAERPTVTTKVICPKCSKEKTIQPAEKSAKESE